MISYKKHILKNGLTLLTHKDSTTPMLAVNIIYKVGARDEQEDLTGFAHLFEHLMFEGSCNVPSFDTPIQMASGENNAFTSNDYTDYYIVLPKDNIETALWIESDRMKALSINQHSLDIQKSVVIEEFNQRYKNKPYGDLWKIIREMCYKEHPYKWQTIGKDISHIQNASLGEVEQFYNTFYNPNNAILSVAGDFEHEYIVELVEKWFGDIENKGVAPVLTVVEPQQTSPRRETVERDVPVDFVYICFKMDKRISKEFVICDTISDILSSGNSSRMVQNLVRDKRLFTSVNAYLTGEIDAGLFVVMGQVAEGIEIATAEAALWGELEYMKTNHIDSQELQKVKNKFEVNTIFGELNVMNKAMNLGFYELLGDIDYINNELECYKSVTREEMMVCSQRVFDVNRSSTLIYKRQK